MSPVTPAQKTQQICQAANLASRFPDLLARNPTPPGFVQALVAGQCHYEAASFLAHAIPPREAVWWARVATLTSTHPTPYEQVAISEIERWLQQPSDEARFRCRALGEKLSPTVPVAALCDAVFFSGSLSIGSPPIPPLECGYSKFVAAAVILCAYLKNPGDPMLALEEFIGMGMSVAVRTGLWQAEEVTV